MACRGCNKATALPATLGLKVRSTPEWSEAEPLTLGPGPHKTKNPLTGQRDLERYPFIKTMWLRGERLGFVNTRPGGAIQLLRPWNDAQLSAIGEAILEVLQDRGYDIEQPRQFSKPSDEGLKKKQDRDDDEEPPRIVMPA